MKKNAILITTVLVVGSLLGLFVLKYGTLYELDGNFSENSINGGPPHVEVPQKIRLAAFNIQIFGKTKREKKEVVDVLVRVIREFDIVLVQEIRDSSEETAPFFLDKINEMGTPLYGFVRSIRLGRSTSKEAYAYFFNTETIELIDGSDYVYNDVDDVFEREPYIASFRSGNFDFTLVGIHTKPDDASSEIEYLVGVIASLQADRYNEYDIVVMGDLNADGRYFDEGDASNHLRAQDYTWVIYDDMDTMIKTDYTYDRIILLNSTYYHEYIMDSADVFYFDSVYNITDNEFLWDISDHYPVFAEFNTGLIDDD
ncbi:hypothetical protein MCGE09_00013 [Thaumarchaeota archaeon SCGC AB-539-E09]|nr:hypothetical protein MCGE09_00013 [Thaumarchaeota archaeon SCGC AB-539-E09]